MPRVSLPPSVASGQVCTLNIATRRMAIRLSLDTHVMNPGIPGAEAIFVFLAAAHEIDGALALLDRLLDQARDQHDAGAEREEGARIVAGVVNHQPIAVVEAQIRR